MIIMDQRRELCRDFRLNGHRNDWGDLCRAYLTSEALLARSFLRLLPAMGRAVLLTIIIAS